MRVRRVGLLACLCAALVACSGGGGKATVLPKITAGASSSPSPDPVPTAAKAATPEGAAAFARFFFAQVAIGFQTKDASAVANLSGPACTTCQRYISSIESLRTKNEHSSPDFRFQITFAEAPAINGPSVRVDIIFNTPDATRYDSQNRVVHHEAAALGVKESLQLERRGRSWLVQEITA